MLRSDIINKLIEANDYKTYLEIGVSNPSNNFDLIKINSKWGVDPSPEYDSVEYRMNSDKFFENLNKEFRYDIIFIDGYHTHEQSMKDVSNSLKFLEENGVIVMHDCIPPNEEYQKTYIEDGEKKFDWCGDVWKTIVFLRCFRPDLRVFTIDTDFGCAIIKKAKSLVPDDIYGYNYSDDNITDLSNFEYFDKYKKRLINIIAENEFDDFLKIIKNNK